jgi:hypothetical protein
MARALAEGTQDARLFLHAAVITGQPEYATKAVALQQMLLPAERKILATLPATNPVVAAQRSVSERTPQPTKEN